MFLPEKYQYSHQFSFFLHNILVNYMKIGERQKWFETTIKFSNLEEMSEAEEIDEEFFLDWLDQNGYKREAYDVFYRMVILGVLSDYCHFIMEGLSCSAKAKMAVAYTLFRKPLKDNLLLLEWLLADPKEFICEFQKDSSAFAPNKISPEKKLNIISKVIDKLGLTGFEPDFIYEIRYKKNVEYGFEPVWNPAAHIVTTSKDYKTESQNLNFVFSGDEDRDSQWEQIYTLIPYFLYYTIEVVEALLLSFIRIPRQRLTYCKLRRQLRFLYWTNVVEHNQIYEEINTDLVPLLEINCVYCKKKIKLNENNKWTFAHHGYIRCNSCKAPVNFKAYLSLARNKPKIYPISKIW